MKQREAQGISLKKRIIGREKEGKKIIKKKKKVTIKGVDNNEENIREGDDFEDETQEIGHSRNGSIAKMSPSNGATLKKMKDIKLLRELNAKEQ